MAVLKIIRAGNPVLRQVARPVSVDELPDMAVLADDMIETLMDARGVGLAAPQVGQAVRMLVYFVPASRSETGEGTPLTVLCNPSLTPLSNETEEAFEGCLSLPGLTGKVPRFRRIGVKALLLSGETFEREVSGFHARVLQHENDHLDGKLYVDRMRSLGSFGFSDEIQEALNSAET